MRLLKLLVVIAICLSVPTAAFAHPGRTDSDGGHTDHSTGEYHYHHGYSAHQHSDRDGDGDLDCPYMFIDKPKPSGSETESQTKTSISANSSANKTSEVVIGIIAVGIFAAPFIAGMVIRAVDAIKGKIKKQ